MSKAITTLPWPGRSLSIFGLAVSLDRSRLTAYGLLAGKTAYSAAFTLAPAAPEPGDE